ncbi:hypothetical protein E2C01_082512 [Portunus trituberculatus]|uniref:Uncharacterized protein n=1 Tax=Portunus trituberculatus TaxID=210409 RepID=A0A5B7IQ50_PORTR|nr:hypothetical protein [Portunus trituberculatus]
MNTRSLRHPRGAEGTLLLCGFTARRDEQRMNREGQGCKAARVRRGQATHQLSDTRPSPLPSRPPAALRPLSTPQSHGPSHFLPLHAAA